MAFQEKSAWIMALALTAGGIFYFGAVSAASSRIDAIAPPNVPLIALYTVILVVIAVAGHIVIGILSPSEANAAIDERERIIRFRSGHWSGYVFATGAVVSLGSYLVLGRGDVLFYGVFASLMLGQLAEYGIRILLHRTSV